jgi:hypothetical protein
MENLEALAGPIVFIASAASLALPVASLLHLRSSSFWALVASLAALVLLAQPALPYLNGSAAIGNLYQAWRAIKGELVALAIGILLSQQVRAFLPTHVIKLMLLKAVVGVGAVNPGQNATSGSFPLCCCFPAESICPVTYAWSAMWSVGRCLLELRIRPAAGSIGSVFPGFCFGLGAGHQVVVSTPLGSSLGAPAEGGDETTRSSSNTSAA